MSAITKLSELKAVNLILRNMAETPVNTLTGNLPLEASLARETLNEASLNLQKQGWFFNTEFHRLVPDHNNEIQLPRNTLSITPIGRSLGEKFTDRSGKLFDIAPFRNSSKFLGPVELKIVFGLPFDDLPASAQSYLALSAARTMASREIGDEVALNEDTSDETRAWAELQAEQVRAEPVTLASSDIVQQVLSPRMHWR